MHVEMYAEATRAIWMSYVCSMPAEYMHVTCSKVADLSETQTLV